MIPELLSAVAELVGAVAWPVVAVVMLFKYRPQVGRLIDRLRKGGPAEFDPATSLQKEADEEVPLLRGAETKPAIEAPHGAVGPPTPIPFRSEFEEAVRNAPEFTSKPSDAKKVEHLISLAGHLAVMVKFEIIDSAIWASQIKLLEVLKSQPQGVDLAKLRKISYEPAKTQNPGLFEEYSFERYLGFLKRNDLVASISSRWGITATGAEYLQWRVTQGKVPKFQG